MTRSNIGVYDTPAKIELFKRTALLSAMRIYASGMKMRLPRTPLQVLSQDYGIKCRTAKEAIPEVERLVLDQKALVEERETPVS